MSKTYLYLFIIITIIIVGGCKKDEDPVPVDLFVGIYDLVSVIEEYDPSNPDNADDKFLAPESFEITKSELLNPITGEMVSSYSFLVGEIFMGLTEQGNSDGMVLVGTQVCPNDDDLRAVSITIQPNSLYRLNMVNCITREVIADYNPPIKE
jgi:hypothetical protein